MSTEKILNYAIWIAGIAVGVFLFPFVLRVFAPFVLAFFVAVPSQRVVGALDKRLHINRGISSAIISTAIVVVATAVVIFVIVQLYSQAKNLLTSLPATIDSLKGQLERLAEGLSRYTDKFPNEISVVLDGIMQNIKDSAQDISKRASEAAISAVGGVAAAVPEFILFVTMFILGTFFFTKDYKLIINFLKELFPVRAVEFLKKIKVFLAKAFTSYLKAQLILMAITAALVTICLWVVGMEYPLLWGIASGLVDVLPFLGTAIILLPLALVHLTYGNIYMFVALIIIQGLVFLFRQLAEPRVVSNQIGIHPILTLVSVYVGLRFFGVIGMIFAPIFMLLLVNFYVSYKEERPRKAI